MKKLFLWTFVLTLLCTWAVVGADQTPITPTTSSAPKAEKERPAQEMLSGKALLSNVAPAKLAVPGLEKEKAAQEILSGKALIATRAPAGPAVLKLEKEKAEAEMQQAEPAVMQLREFAPPVKAPYTGPANVPDQNVILQGGETCADATVIAALPYVDTDNTTGHIDDYDEACPYSSTSPDLVYSYSPVVSGCITISTCSQNTLYDTKLFVYENDCVSPAYACNDDAFDLCPVDDYQSVIDCMPVTAGNIYYIVVDGYGGDSGQYELTVSECECPIDPCENAIYHNGEPDAVNGYSCERHISQGWDSWVVDDVEFLEATHISDIHWWTIDMGITWNGTDDLIILADAGGVPGATVVEMYDVPNLRYATGEFIFGYPVYLYTLYVDITLPAGYYWLGVRPVSDDGGQSFWATAPLTGSEVYFKSAYFGYPDWTSGFDAWGEYQNVAFCLTDEPWPEDGACCFEDGSCIVMMPDDCTTAGGVFWGLGTDCDPNPCPQPCFPDFSVTAPVVDATGTTCGAGDDCNLMPSEEIIYEVEIPNDGEWTFSLCDSDFDTYLFVGTTCCGAEVGENDDFCGVQSQLTAYVTAGTYYVDIEAYSGCGNYVLNVYEEAAQTGACCVGTDCVATETETECLARPGVWYAGETCPEFPCPTVPDNDLCENAEPIVGPYPASGSGTTIGSTLDCPGVLDWTAVWYTIELPYASNDVDLHLCGSTVELYSVGIIFTPDCSCDLASFIYPAFSFDPAGCPTGYSLDLDLNAYPGPATIYWPAMIQDAGYNNIDFDYIVDVTEQLPCIVECPPESYIEQEACGDDVNGGCNMIPPPPQYWEPIESGMTVCGTAWADADFRDTDWYVYELTEYSTVTWVIEAEFPSQPIFFTSNTDCVTNTYEYAFLDPCTPYQFQATLPPGEHWLWMGDQAFAGNPCGGGNDDYVFTLTCEPLQPCENIVTVEILTDDYPTETTWDLVYVATGEVVGSGGPYSDPQTMYTAEACIDVDPTGCYLFTIYDSFGDGISLPPGFYSVYDPAFVLVCSGGGDFGYEESCYFGTCEPAACCIGSTCEDLTPQECADAGGTWYYGEDCATFDCPLTCDDAVWHNGDPNFASIYASQCAPEQPFQGQAADDVIFEVNTNVEAVVSWLDGWNNYGDPFESPADFEGIQFVVYPDVGGVPGGNPLDDVDCSNTGDIVYEEIILPGDFSYMADGSGWKVWFNLGSTVTLQANTTYWVVVEPIFSFTAFGQGGPITTEVLGSLPLLFFPAAGITEWATPDSWTYGLAFCLLGEAVGPPLCDYVPGDCNHNDVALELADVIAMIGMYRGTVTPAYTCDCPPHGATFAPEADPNGNCVALELADVVAEIAAYRGTGTAYGCVDCPGDGPPPPLLGKEGTSVVPSLKSKVKTTQQGSAD